MKAAQFYTLRVTIFVVAELLLSACQYSGGARGSSTDFEDSNDRMAKFSVEEKSASRAVVKILVPAGTAVNLAEIEKVLGQDSYAKVYKALPSRQSTVGGRRLYELQLKRCEARHLAFEKCTIRDGLAQATAFAIGDGHQLVTVFHTVRRMIRVLRAENGTSFNSIEEIKGYNLPMVAVDAQERVVEVGEVHLVSLPEATMSVVNSDEELQSMNPLVDFALLSIEKPLPYALPIADRVPNEPVTIMGYPEPGSLKVVHGTLEDLKAGLTRSGHVEVPEWEAHVFSSEAPTGPGFSGGPVLNSKGQAIGLHQSGKAAAQVSFGTSLNYFLK